MRERWEGGAEPPKPAGSGERRGDAASLFGARQPSEQRAPDHSYTQDNQILSKLFFTFNLGLR